MGLRKIFNNENFDLRYYVLCHVASQIWQLLQHSMAGTLFPFQRRWEKSYVLFYNVFFQTWFSIPYTTIVFRILKTIPAPPCFVALTVWHSYYLAPLKSGVWKYIGPRINYCLYLQVVNGSDRLINWSEAVNLQDAVAHVHKTSSAPVSI